MLRWAARARAPASLGSGEGCDQQTFGDELVEVVGDQRPVQIQGSGRLVAGDGRTNRGDVLVQPPASRVVETAQPDQLCLVQPGARAVLVHGLL